MNTTPAGDRPKSEGFDKLLRIAPSLSRIVTENSPLLVAAVMAAMLHWFSLGERAADFFELRCGLKRCLSKSASTPRAPSGLSSAALFVVHEVARRIVFFSR